MTHTAKESKRLYFYSLSSGYSSEITVNSMSYTCYPLLFIRPYLIAVYYPSALFFNITKSKSRTTILTQPSLPQSAPLSPVKLAHPTCPQPISLGDSAITYEETNTQVRTISDLTEFTGSTLMEFSMKAFDITNYIKEHTLSFKSILPRPVNPNQAHKLITSASPIISMNSEEEFSFERKELSVALADVSWIAGG